jgi:hypothetical protein
VGIALRFQPGEVLCGAEGELKGDPGGAPPVTNGKIKSASLTRSIRLSPMVAVWPLILRPVRLVDRNVGTAVDKCIPSAAVRTVLLGNTNEQVIERCQKRKRLTSSRKKALAFEAAREFH